MLYWHFHEVYTFCVHSTTYTFLWDIWRKANKIIQKTLMCKPFQDGGEKNKNKAFILKANVTKCTFGRNVCRRRSLETFCCWSAIQRRPRFTYTVHHYNSTLPRNIQSGSHSPRQEPCHGNILLVNFLICPKRALRIYLNLVVPDRLGRAFFEM